MGAAAAPGLLCDMPFRFSSAGSVEAEFAVVAFRRPLDGSKLISESEKGSRAITSASNEGGGFIMGAGRQRRALNGYQQARRTIEKNPKTGALAPFRRRDDLWISGGV